MGKSLYQLIQEAKKQYKTTNNTYEMFKVGSKVKIITLVQDFNFFNGETGIVISNTGGYLGITVEYDEPRYYKNGTIEKSWNFNPDDLIRIDLEEENELLERWISLCK